MRHERRFDDSYLLGPITRILSSYAQVADHKVIPDLWRAPGSLMFESATAGISLTHCSLPSALSVTYEIQLLRHVRLLSIPDTANPSSRHHNQPAPLLAIQSKR